MRHNADDKEEIVHVPVMWREVLEFAEQALKSGGKFVDCTLGEGGHSEMLLNAHASISLTGFERDREIFQIAKRRLAVFESRIRLVNDNFSNMPDYLSGNEEEKVNFILYDFGISSFHFEKSKRGFAFGNDEPLDMRLTSGSEKDARYVINKYSENDLNDIFFTYGEERWSRKIARDICKARSDKAIETTFELAEIVKRSIPARFRVKNIHPATRVFQAVRIEVNDELNAIRKSLSVAHRFLAKGGIITAISFHSLEDRIVKDVFRRLSKGCTCEMDGLHCRCEEDPIVSILTKKPIQPTNEEVFENRRSRSAKLRACVKL